ncbi:MAG: hypothetical protein ACRDSR_23020 [Pseudonocardiaceae bacterium]
MITHPALARRPGRPAVVTLPVAVGLGPVGIFPSTVIQIATHDPFG